MVYKFKLKRGYGRAFFNLTTQMLRLILKTKLILSFLCIVCGLVFAETKLEYWTFAADTAGASFENGSGGIKNNGNNASLWNHSKSKV